MTAMKSSTEQLVTDVLASQRDVTVAELAERTGLGRSTVGKALAKLERARRARRSVGGRDGKRRLPDGWSPTAEEASARPPRTGERLRPGQLDGLVLAYLEQHEESGPHGPTTVAKALGRSSGAVGNCLARLAAAGRLRQVKDRPRRYMV